MRELLDKILNAADASTDQNGLTIPAQNLFATSVQAVVTGTSTGTLKLQFSNDIVNPTTPASAPTNWSDISGATVSIAGAGIYSIPRTELCYQFVRAVYVHDNGAAGTITAIQKSLGA